MASRALRALIMGAPGSGKGTIAKRIITDFDMKFISAGDILRSHVSQGTGTSYMDVDKTCNNWTTPGYANSWTANSRTGRLADWSTSGLDSSRTSQLADGCRLMMHRPIVAHCHRPLATVDVFELLRVVY